MINNNPIVDALTENLNKVFGVEAEETQMEPIRNIEGEIVVSEENPDDYRKLEADHEATRRNIMNLLRKSDGALQSALSLVSSSESPRAIEALSNLMKTISDINSSLLDSHVKVEQVKSKKKGKGEIQATQNNITQNNVVFNGTADELQKMIEQKEGNN